MSRYNIILAAQYVILPLSVPCMSKTALTEEFPLPLTFYKLLKQISLTSQIIMCGVYSIGSLVIMVVAVLEIEMDKIRGYYDNQDFRNLEAVYDQKL